MLFYVWYTFKFEQEHLFFMYNWFYQAHLVHYPDADFDETIPCELIRAYQGDLQALSARICLRNVPLKVPYTYMDPAKVENSVAI